jgi:hypothetical protein
MDDFRAAHAHDEFNLRDWRCTHWHWPPYERPHTAQHDDGIAGMSHICSTSKHVVDFILQFWWVCYMAYCLSMIGAKISVGLSLLRITPFTFRTHRWIIQVVVCTSVLTGCIFGLLTAFECAPVRYFWGRALGETGKCISMDVIMALTYVMSAIFAVCDFTFALLPVFLIKGLNMSRNSKIALIPILSMACMYVIPLPLILDINRMLTLKIVQVQPSLFASLMFPHSRTPSSFTPPFPLPSGRKSR